MEKVISKIVKYILEKKYPVFTDVQVTNERDYERSFVDKKKSIKYNIFLQLIILTLNPFVFLVIGIYLNQKLKM